MPSYQLECLFHHPTNMTKLIKTDYLKNNV